MNHGCVTTRRPTGDSAKPSGTCAARARGRAAGGRGLGAPLARMEMEIAFNELLRRFPKMELASEIKRDPRILGRSIEPPIHLNLA